MRKIFNIFMIFILITWLLPFKTYSLNNEWYFVVTAYYSPLPNQKSYLTWNYESEKRLNWQWIRWASWKAVFSWMLAAPKNYKFWTKIYLEWLWVWVVEDRWWAIVNAWNRGYSYDRIDVWVGYWDEWLKRALYWGKRTIKWNIIDSNSVSNLDYSKILAPDWATSGLTNKMNLFNYWIWVWSETTKVKKLQSFLNEIWIYNGEISWIYNNELIDLIYEFQIKNWLIKEGDYFWAWYWWKQTRTLFKKMYLAGDFDIKDNIISNETKEIKEDKSVIAKEITLTSEQNLIFWNTANSIEQKKKVQEILKITWFYNWEINWIKKDFIDSIYNFQIEKWILKSEYDLWAWFYWPKTRASLKESYLTYLNDEENKRIKILKNEIEEEKKKKEEEERKKELEEKYKKIDEFAYNQAKQKVDFVWNVKFWEISHSVRELQKILIDLDYLNTKDTAIFWNQTKEAIITFQYENKIIGTKDDISAWVVWPKTLNWLKNILKDKFIDIELAKQQNSALKEVAINWNFES